MRNVEYDNMLNGAHSIRSQYMNSEYDNSWGELMNRG